jgi:AraC family transcriptional regulator of arabinose operon
MGSDYMLDLTLTDCGEEVCRPAYQYGPRVRQYILMHAVIKGKGVLHNDYGDFSVHSGQAFFIFPDEITVYQADAIHPWHYIWTGWIGEDTLPLLQELGISRQSPVLDLGVQAESIYSCMRRIYKDAVLRRGELAGIGGLLRLLALMGDCGRVATNTAQTYYNRAMWLMEHEQPEAPLKVEEMAQTLGISRSQLFRIFCQTGGSSPKETLTRHRCEQALQLISQTDLSLEQIAYSCCFASAQHLRDTFRREGFAPPSSYRRDK